MKRRFLLTVETNGRPGNFPEVAVCEALRRLQLHLADVQEERLPLLFLAWRRAGGASRVP
jgi:hypothetical protein